MTHKRDDTGGGLSNVNTQNSPEPQQMLLQHSPKCASILRRVEREEALISFKRTFKQTPRVPFKSGRVKVWLPRFAQSQKRCRGFISFLSAVCTRPGRQRRGEAVDQCDNIHGNTMTTGVWTWSRGSPMPFLFWMRRKPICGKIKWDDTASLADDWLTWRSNILPMFTSMYFQPNPAVDQRWTMN